MYWILATFRVDDPNDIQQEVHDIIFEKHNEDMLIPLLEQRGPPVDFLAAVTNIYSLSNSRSYDTFYRYTWDLRLARDGVNLSLAKFIDESSERILYTS